MKLRAYLSLFRIPVIFSAMSNIYAGYFIAGGIFFSWRLLAGMAASSLIIMAGMALNDVADRKIDTKERPERPIPSGAVSAKAAVRFSVAFIILALLLIGRANLPSLIPALMLCYGIYVYNFLIDRKKHGPAGMAALRVLNLIMGLTLGLKGNPFVSILGWDVLLVLLSLGTYIFLITHLSSREAEGNSRTHVNYFLVGTIIWLVLWAAVLFTGYDGMARIAGLALLLIFTFFLGSSLVPLLQVPDNKNTQHCVSVMLLAIPVVDVLGMLANNVSLPIVLAGLLFIPLAVLTGRKFYST